MRNLILILLLFFNCSAFGQQAFYNVLLSNTTDEFTVFLSHFDGANGSTTITDETGKSITAYGTAQLSTARKEFGTASLLLDGNSDYIDTPDSDDFYFNTNDFCIETWIYTTTLGSSQKIFNQESSSPVTFIDAFYSSSVGLRWDIYNAGSALVGISEGTTALTANTWHHVAFVRYGNKFSIYLDGVDVANVTTSVTVPNVSSDIRIGKARLSSQYWNGNFDEYRISNGSARYTGNFTPPTSPFNY